MLNDDLSPVEIKSLIANCDYFIGTRMHSNIFATSMCIPTIAIAYEKKTNGIMHTIGLDDYIIEMNEITTEKLLSKIRKQEKNSDEIKELLEKRIISVRMEIIDKIKKILREN